MNIVGTAKVKPLTKHTRNLFGSISAIEGQTLNVLERNESGDCLCLLPDQSGLVDLDHQDVECFQPAINTNDLFWDIIEKMRK